MSNIKTKNNAKGGCKLLYVHNNLCLLDFNYGFSCQSTSRINFHRLNRYFQTEIVLYVSIKRLKLYFSCIVALFPIHGGRGGSGGYTGIADLNGCTQACSLYLSSPLSVDALRRTQLPAPFMRCWQLQ